MIFTGTACSVECEKTCARLLNQSSRIFSMDQNGLIFRVASVIFTHSPESCRSASVTNAQRFCKHHNRLKDWAATTPLAATLKLDPFVDLPIAWRIWWLYKIHTYVAQRTSLGTKSFASKPNSWQRVLWHLGPTVFHNCIFSNMLMW